MIKLLLLHLSYLGLGLGLSRLVHRKPISTLYQISRAYLIGLIVFIACLYLNCVLAVSTFIPAYLLCFLGLLCLLGFYWQIVKFLRAPMVWPSGLNILIVLSFLPPVCVISVQLLGLPAFSFDGTAIWALKAAFLFQGEHLWSPAFQDLTRVHPQVAYPLFHPIFIYSHFLAAGELNEHFAKTGLLIFYFNSFLLMYHLFRKIISSPSALLCLGLVLYVPALSYKAIYGGMTNLYADFPFALFLFFSSAFGISFIRSGDKIDGLASTLSLLACLLIKDEGIPFLLSSMFSYLFYCMLQPDTRQRLLGWIVFPCLAVFIPYVFLRSQLPASSDLSVPGLVTLSAWPLSILAVIRLVLQKLFFF